MKNSRQRRLVPRDVPYERDGIENWRSTAQAYGFAKLLAVPANERGQWMEHPCFKDLNVFSCGYFETARGHAWTRRDLNEGVLLYCVDGEGRYLAQGKEVPVHAGDVLYCHPETDHSYHAQKEKPWTIYWMHLCGDQLAFFSDRMGVSLENPVRSIGIRSDLIRQFRELIRRFEPIADEKTRLLSNEQARCILATIAVLPELPPRVAQHSEMVNHLIDVMQDRISSTLTIDELCRIADISPSYLYRVFKQVTGFSPMDYFNRLHVRVACSMLTSTQKPVYNIAEDLGFDDPYYFSRLFKRICGLSPRQYRSDTRQLGN